MKYLASVTLFLSIMIMGCNSQTNEPGLNLSTLQDSTNISYTITGLDGPEAVRYDPDQKVYFISNFTGGGNDQDSTGFITKTNSEGDILDLQFMTGTENDPLHAPRGMFIIQDTLWVADVLGVHAFNKKTGKQINFTDFTDFEIGFLNDIAADEKGNLYVTDTGTSSVFKISNDSLSLFIDKLPAAPNGITFDSENKEFLLAPWGGSQAFYSFDTSGELREYATLEGGYFDGIEFSDNVLFSASQQDSSIRIYNPVKERMLIKTTGRSADIGFNTHLKHIAVPYIALDKVEIWDISEN